VGDHGEEFFEHRQKGHRNTLYDEQLLVPLIMRLPETLPAGRRVAMQIRMADIPDTILALVGVTGFERSGGKDLSPYILGERAEVDLPALSYLFNGSVLLRTLRDSGLKIQVTMPPDRVGRAYRGRVELFDLVADPKEQRSLGEGAQLEIARAAFDAAFAEEQALRAQVNAKPGVAITIPAAMRRALEALGYSEIESP
jgi:arylsulfatase A-like enzyme